MKQFQVIYKTAWGKNATKIMISKSLKNLVAKFDRIKSMSILSTPTL